MKLHRICINYILPFFVINVFVWSIVNTRGRSLWFNLRSGNKGLPKKSVLIVIWTNFYNNHARVTFTQRWRPFLKHCEQLNCRFTEDRSLVGKADAVMFSLLETNVSDLPPIRHPWQYYILFTQEPPYLTYRTRPGRRNRNPSREMWKRFNGFFNLTWTYRQDSDIVDRHYGTAARLKTDPLPYDRVPTTTTKQVSAIVAGKEKLIAWFVSNCHAVSRRFELVKELMKYVPVHIYGRCAKRFCGSSRAHGGNCVPLFCHHENSNANASNFGSCDGKLAKEYKFYLAFENEVCKDYVTEKFFRVASYVVPIVMQHDHASQFAPNSSIYPSYIAVDDFISVKRLAEYLLYLNRNQEAYRRYYDWHETMYIQQYREDQGIYELCSRLRTGAFPEMKVYEDVYDWWNAAARCQGGNWFKVSPSTCKADWPNLELLVTMPNKAYPEFHDQLLRSLLFFWPRDKLNMVLVLDAERKDAEFEKTLLNDTRDFNAAHIEYNAPSKYYGKGGHDRQQLVMFWADNYTSAEYVGFVDTDTFFVTPVDLGDLFEDGKPVVIGLFGNKDKHRFWSRVPQSTWSMLKVLEPMRCMNYFPVIIKADHLKALRAHVKRTHQKNMDEYFRTMDKSRYSQFNIMCAFVWHFYRDDYVWYVEEYDNKVTSVKGQYRSKQEAGIQAVMLYPKPRVALHSTYHVPRPSNQFFLSVLTAGFCYDKWANGWTNEIERWCKINGVKMEVENRNQYEFELADHAPPLRMPEIIKGSFGKRQTRRKQCPHKWDRDELKAIGFSQD